MLYKYYWIRCDIILSRIQILSRPKSLQRNKNENISFYKYYKNLKVNLN